MKYFFYSIVSIFSMLFLFISCQINNQNLNLKKDFTSKDSISTEELFNFLDTTKIKLNNNKLFMEFMIGQSKEEVEQIIKIKNISIKFDKYYVKIPTGLFDNSKEINLNTEVKFIYNENSKLKDIILYLYAPCNFVNNNLKNTPSSKNLKDLEDMILNPDKQKVNDELEKMNKDLEIIKLSYVSRIYNSVRYLYEQAYGKGIIIKNSIFDNKLYSQSNKLDINIDYSLLWLPDGRYIEFNYYGSDHISKEYYYSGLNCDKEIALGFITYSSVESKALEYKDFKLNYNTEYNKKYKDSVDQVNKNTELNRIKKIGI